MDEQMESYGTFEETRESASSETPAGGDDLQGPSRELPEAQVTDPREPISSPEAEAANSSSFQEQLDDLNIQIEEVIERKLQSGKDKRMERIEGEMKKLTKEMAALRTKSAGRQEGEETQSSAKASHVIQPSGGGLPAPDPRAEYEKRVAELRPGDIGGLMELKREYRRRGLEIY